MKTNFTGKVLSWWWFSLSERAKQPRSDGLWHSSMMLTKGCTHREKTSSQRPDKHVFDPKQKESWSLLHIPVPLSFTTLTSAAMPQLPWQKLSGLLAYGVTSIWVLKAGYCFCGADVGGHEAQLTGLHSWEWCVWPTYRGAGVSWEPQS